MTSGLPARNREMKQTDPMARRYRVGCTFEYNKAHGPFERPRDRNPEIAGLLEHHWVKTDFFGFRTKLPLGVAAGPLYNSDYMIAAARDGFTVLTWKTFRSVDRLAHRSDGSYAGHNILFVDSSPLGTGELGGQLLGQRRPSAPPAAVSITNSFGMPSPKPHVWMPEVHELEGYMAQREKPVITSVVGTPKPGGDLQDLARDYAFLARCAESAGARIVEINFSCPNVSGREGSIYRDPGSAALIARTVREMLREDKTKLLIKVGHAGKAEYRKLLRACAEQIDGVVAINTLPMEIVDGKGRQALPGGLKSGVCGTAILGLAVEAVANLRRAKEALGLDKLKIVGCGGVVAPAGFFRHVDAGAEFVMCATAALFNPKIPLEVAREIRERKIRTRIG